jgi:hypothetical protein
MEITTNEDKPKKNIWNEIAERALRTGNNVPAVEVEFDVEKALAGLAWNFDHNRKPKNTVINSFADTLENGGFATGSTLRIARNQVGQWVLVDGQHRLLAIAKSGRKTWMMIIADERAANIAYAKFDNLGTIRTSSDVFVSLLGWRAKNWSSVIAAARIIYNKYSFTDGALKITENEKEGTAETLNAFRKEIEWVCAQDPKGNSLAITRAPTLSVILSALKYQRDIAEPWFLAAVADDRLAKLSPEKLLSDSFHLSCARYSDRKKVLYLTATIWNLKFTGMTVQRTPQVFFGNERETQWPGIMGTPYVISK